MSTELKESPVIRNLSEDLRAKALEYASALGARGPRPTTVLGTAITLAQEWKGGRLSAETDGDRGIALLVQPRGGRWVIRRANAPEPTHVFSVREDAVRRAQELAVIVASPVFVFGPGGTLLERYAAPSKVATGAVRPAPRPAALASRAVAYPRPIVAPEPSVAEASPAASVTVPTLSTAPLAVETAVLGQVVVTKSGRRWDVRTPDGAVQSFTTRKKAAKTASDLGASLGVPVSGL